MSPYDPFQRRKRTINDPINPIPNYIPPVGTASVGTLDSGIKRQLALNKSLAAPGGLSPYYGSVSYTQRAQASRPVVPATYGPPTPFQPVTAGWISPTIDTSIAIAKKFSPGGTNDQQAQPTGLMAGNAWLQRMGQTADEASSPVAPQVTKPAENATQRWQNFGQTALDQRPGPQPAFTEGQRRFAYTGRIGGYAAPSANERMTGATPVEDWRKIFGSNTSL